MTSKTRSEFLASPKFSRPSYTMGEAAKIVGVAYATLSNWARPYGNGRRFPGLITKLEPWSRRSVPFVGLAEAMVLKELRDFASLQTLRKALGEISSSAGEPRHFLANERFYLSGADVLYNHSDEVSDLSELVVVNKRPPGQIVFVAVVRDYLKRIKPEFDESGHIKLMRLPYYKVAEVVVDPLRGGGDPIFAQGGCRVRNVLHRFSSGETLESCSEEFGVPVSHIEDALRVLSRHAT